ncbi:MAG: transposase family protein, partial [bacterium]|nr:transposase family protein [bacterium]
MSKPSRRANRQGILELRKQKRKAEKKLRQAQRGQGVVIPPGAAISNGKSRLKDVAQETQARQQAVSEQVRIFRNQLPILLKRLSRIEDPRNAKKTKYQLTLLMIYGILSFVFQMASRREANREMSLPMFKQNLKLLFPELDHLPHSDTLMRLLERINVAQIESAHLDL